MNYKMMGKFISQILFVEAAFMLPALLISVLERNIPGIWGFALSIVITAAVASVLYVLCRHAVRRFYAREGLVCVGMSWIFMSLLGCLPFFMSGEIPNFLDALFEIPSGCGRKGRQGKRLYAASSARGEPGTDRRKACSEDAYYGTYFVYDVHLTDDFEYYLPVIRRHVAF